MAVLGFIVALVVRARVISNVHLKIDNSRVSDVRPSSRNAGGYRKQHLLTSSGVAVTERLSDPALISPSVVR